MFTALKESQFYFYLLITAAGVVPCGGPKKSLRTSSIVQIIFSFWSFEISEDILRYQKIIGLDSFSNLCFNIYYFGPIFTIQVSVSNFLLKDVKLQ